jgi:predicted amidohydrolase
MEGPSSDITVFTMQKNCVFAVDSVCSSSSSAAATAPVAAAAAAKMNQIKACVLNTL